MFEYNEDENKWDTAHHMFTWPQEQYHATMESDPGSVKGDLYDLVLNGFELASGSIRIHDPALQKRVFKIVGFDPAEAEKKFGFLTEAFKYGAPPHGGIAPGLDRLVMLMAGETSIKEVIAFPKNSFAVSPMDECPNEVDQKQLDELHLSIRCIIRVRAFKLYPDGSSRGYSRRRAAAPSGAAFFFYAAEKDF
jgi:aspartyl-tRNA synthetase